MKLMHVFAVTVSASLLAGCASHRPVTYNTPPVYRDDPISASRYDTPAPVYGSVRDASDRDLALAVRNQFGRYGDLSGYLPNIDVSARSGTVTLAGSVPGEREKEMILAMVRNTPGVMAVNDLLRMTHPVVSPTGGAGRSLYADSADDYFNLHVQGLSETDRALAQKILAELRTDSVLASSVPKVNIFVADGEVILRGIVQTEQQRQTIAAAVERAVGISRLQNELVVQRLPR